MQRRVAVQIRRVDITTRIYHQINRFRSRTRRRKVQRRLPVPRA